MKRTVLGAGFGGLTAGALLAKTGDDVDVLEAHHKPGGCATTFKSFDLEIEVSLHDIERKERAKVSGRWVRRVRKRVSSRV